MGGCIYETRLSLGTILGPSGAGIAAAMQAGLRFLETAIRRHCCKRSAGHSHDARRFVRSTSPRSRIPTAGTRGAEDDFLVGRGLFYLTEQRQLLLDCTSGHYQMLWGYNHPDLWRR